MSHSPVARIEGERTDPYTAGWSAVNRLARRGDSWSGGERNVCFLNAPTGATKARPAFLDVAGAVGLDHDDDGRAAARLDLDFDGDDDLVVTARTGPRARFLVNRVADGAEHLGVRLVGTRSNRDALGAVVTATPVTQDVGGADGPLVLRRTRRAGEGYLAQSSAALSFGFGRRGSAAALATRARVEVRWPDGTVEPFGELAAGRTYRLVEGAGRAAEAGDPSAVALAPAALAPGAPPTEAQRLVLAAPRAIPGLDAETRDGRPARLFGATPNGPLGTGRPTLVLVWGSWCAPCLGELQRFEGARQALAAAGLDVLALCADSTEDRALAETARAAAGWRGPTLFAAPAALEVLDAVLEDVRDRPTRMPLPTAFLFEADGALAVVYVGGVAPDAVRGDLALLGSAAQRRADLATPFRGRWRTRPDAHVDARRLPPDSLGARLASRGLDAAVRELELARAVVQRSDERDVRLTVARARVQQSTVESVTEALGIYEALVAADPADLEALAGRALCLTALGRGEEALAVWRDAVAAWPTSAEARASLGFALVAQGDLHGARAEERAVRASEAPSAVDLADRLAAAIAAAEARKDGAGNPKEPPR